MTPTRKMAIISSSRAIDLKDIIGRYELSVVPYSLMDKNRSLHSGHQAKSKLINVLKSSAGEKSTLTCPPVDCLAIDGFCMLHHVEINSNVKTGADLVKVVSSWIGKRISGHQTVAIAFDTYKDNSLKAMTREGRYNKATHYQITASVNITNRSMHQLLSHSKTKYSIVDLLLQYLPAYLLGMGLDYVVSGNGRTLSNMGTTKNNHEEADTLLIHCLKLCQPTSKNAHVYANDTDVIVLLLSHFKQTLDYTSMYVGVESTVLDIKHVHSFLGAKRALALMSIHCLTGGDTTGKFKGVSKEKWAKLFLRIDFEKEGKLLDALIELQTTAHGEQKDELEKLISWGYVKHLSTLAETRFYLYSKEKVSSDRIPPTRGAFDQHVKRAFHQLRQYKTAEKEFIDIRSPSECGWEKIDEEYIPATTKTPIAPDSVIQLISCKCIKGGCTKNCSCLRSGENCTDFCGCSGCQNTDPKMPTFNLIEEELVDEDENI